MLTGQKLSDLRLQKGLTQEQLAEKLFVTRELVSKWERGVRQPDYNTVLRIAEALSVDPDTIVCRDDVVLDELSACLPEEMDGNADALMQALNAFLAKQNERVRSVFIRRYYYMEEISAIAEHYGIKESYVRTILMRTRKKLTKFLKEMKP